MKKILKNYKATLILVLAVIIGVMVGLFFKDVGVMIKPLGDVFINLLLVIIVPLIFLTITTSIAKMGSPKRLGKIMGTTLIMFIVTSIVAVIIGFVSTYGIDLVSSGDATLILEGLDMSDAGGDVELSILERTAGLITVGSFGELLTTDNLIALLVFSVLFGIAINMAGEKGDSAKKVLNSFHEIIMKLMKIIMYYAPVGIGAYAAYLTSTFGASIAVGYLKVFVIYTIVSLVYYFIIALN